MVRSSGLVFGLAVSCLWAQTALAEPSAADRATARSLAGEGYQALQSKDYAAAADRFGRADALVHAPTLMVDWARALVGLRKLVEAQERYEQIIREGVDAKAPKSWQRALNDAANELADLKPRLSWITILVNGSDAARVTIDGAPVPPAAIGVRRAVNPGSRLVRVQAKGFTGQKRLLDLREGAEDSVTFDLEPDPDARVAPLPMPPAVPAPVSSVEEPSRTPMYVAFSASAVGFIVGGVTGVLALNKRAALADACLSDRTCPSSSNGDKKAYDTLGVVSGVGFGVGIVGAGAGLTFWYLNHQPARPAAGGLQVHPYLGLASVGATGSF